MNSVEDVMLDLAWRRFSDLWSDKREIETKVSILLTANGVLLGFIANAWEILNSLLAVAGVLLIWLSATFCVVSLKTRKYKELGILESWDAFEKHFNDVKKLKLVMISTLGMGEKHNRQLVSASAKWYSWGNMTFLAAMSCIITSLLFNLF